MTDEQMLQKARQIAAGAADMEGHDPQFAQFMREGAYDQSDRAVIAALAAVRYGYAQGKKVEAAPAVSLVA